MPRGGKRKGSGQPKKYTDPVEIRIRLEREDRELINQYCEKNQIGDRNSWLSNHLLSIQAINQGEIDLDGFPDTLPYTQESYQAAYKVCQSFDLQGRHELIEAIATTIDSECKKGKLLRK